MRRILLLCAGKGTRWNNHLDVPKHLIEIDGERLIDRSVRLARERGGDEIYIISAHAGYEVAGAVRADPVALDGEPVDTDKFLNSAHLWSRTGQTILLYGDVFFTDRAMDLILASRQEYAFFGRPSPSQMTGCGWQEIFAVTFLPGEQQQILAALNHLRAAVRSGEMSRGGGWELYRYLRNIQPVCDLALQSNTDGAFVEIDDFTEDFDYPSDYDKWIWCYEAYKQWLAGAGVRTTIYGVSPGLSLK